MNFMKSHSGLSRIACSYIEYRMLTYATQLTIPPLSLIQKIQKLLNTALIQKLLNTELIRKLLRIYTEYTKKVHQKYTGATQELHKRYAEATQQLYKSYAEATQKLCKSYAEATQNLHRMNTESIQKGPVANDDPSSLYAPQNWPIWLVVP